MTTAKNKNLKRLGLKVERTKGTPVKDFIKTECLICCEKCKTIGGALMLVHRRKKGPSIVNITDLVKGFWKEHAKKMPKCELSDVSIISLKTV